MAKSKWLNNIARLIKKKDNKGYFLIFERTKDKDKNYKGEDPFPLTINEGDIFQARLKKDDLAKLVEDGTMSEEVAEKICEFVKFEFSRAPQEGKKTESEEETDEVEEKPKKEKPKTTKKPKQDDEF